jgi:hypothetical protein
MSESLAERCEHGDCDFDSRLEYCEVEAAKPDGPLVETTDLIDILLCEPDYIADSDFFASFGPNEGLIRRHFPMLTAAGETTTETTISISHTQERQPSRDRYAIAVNWIAENAGSIIHKDITAYSIDVYPSGPIQAMVSERDDEARRLTPYDVGQLNGLLEDVVSLHLTSANIKG